MDFMISQFCEEDTHKVYNTNKQGGDGGIRVLHQDDSDDSEMENRLPPEMHLGNIEYKAKLIDPSPSRLQHLVTQMKWRLREGQGEAIYEVGVEDGGEMRGLVDEELAASLATLRTMARELHADLVVLTEREVSPRGATVRRSVVEVLIRKVPESQQFIELRVAILGGLDVGKSTLCGVITQGYLDDGHGKTRQNLFRFPHEVRTGRTSSVCLDVVGFDAKGKIVNYLEHSLEEMVERSSKLVTLIDLAGDTKYLKTTIHGLSGYNPHFACLLVSAETGPTATTREHLGLAAALSIPVIVIITKRDVVEKTQLDRVIRTVSQLVTRAGMTVGRRIKTKRDAVKAASALGKSGAVPILALSSVTGVGMRMLRCLLHVLPTRGPMSIRNQLVHHSALFTLEEIFTVPHVGTVVGGMVVEGVLREGSIMWIGPFRDGSFQKAQIGSIRRSKQPVRCVFPGEAASVSISLVEDTINSKLSLSLRRGMVLQCVDCAPRACQRFTASLFLLSHSTSQLCVGFQATVYIGSVRQTATVVDMDVAALGTGKWATVCLEFVSHAEFVRNGTPLIFRQGKTKGMGEVLTTVEM